MFVKVIHKIELPTVAIHQCERVHISNGEDGSTTIVLDDDDRVLEFKNVGEWQVFLMNDEGKTIDKIMM